MRPNTLATAEEWLWSRVNLVNACYLWTGATDSDGYGQVKFAGRTEKAHRVAYYLYYGVDPGILEVCHTCDHPICLNPEHLFLGTHADNMQDMERKGRSNHPGSFKSGVTHPNLKLTDEQVAEVRRLHATRSMSDAAIARQFNVSKTLVYLLVHNKQRSLPAN